MDWTTWQCFPSVRTARTGPTDAAGGVVDGKSRALLEAQGLRIPAILDANDAYHGLEACDGLLGTGPTGTNVNDVSVVLIDG